MVDQLVQIFGIRHHGPGSSRSLLRSLDLLGPDILLVEGPPEADSIIHLAGLPTMEPPVAILIYTPDAPKNAVFYPYASFSPEWSALQFALARNIPFRFIDLPQTNQLGSPDDDHDNTETKSIPADPFGFLAEAAGYSDSERWWENLVEHRRDDLDVFAAILEGTTALREEIAEEETMTERRREAAMRQGIRKAKSEGFQKIAVVCGAWHAPALIDLSGSKTDSSLLTGLAKTKVAATWTPWTYNRLAYRSGYGAGIESPGWYEHLWNTDINVTARWMTRVSQLLREHDLPASPAHIIEAVRLAETLAALRGRPIPGIAEMNEAVQTVFSFGSNLQLQLIEDKLIVGDKLGSVPPETPMVPLQRDIEKLQKSLRLPPETFARNLDLDLRKDNDLARSHLLHRLDVLGIPWGDTQKAYSAKGTFHELWKLQWRPEFAIAIIEGAHWGNSVVDASENKATEIGENAASLAEITKLLNKVILAGLSSAVSQIVHRMQVESSVTNDVGVLMDSLPQLVSISRYGNVRKSDAESVNQVVVGLVSRICIGLSAATASLDDDAADVMFERIKHTHESISLFGNAGYRSAWLESIQILSNRQSVHGKISGRACRILFDSQVNGNNEIARAFGLALSKSSEPIHSAQWLEGFLQNSGQLLALDDGLRSIVDEWISSLDDDTFELLLPLVRRTFSTFTAPERKELGVRIKTAGQKTSADWTGEPESFDSARAAMALPLIRQLLGRTEKSKVTA